MSLTLDAEKIIKVPLACLGSAAGASRANFTEVELATHTRIRVLDTADPAVLVIRYSSSVPSECDDAVALINARVRGPAGQTSVTRSIPLDKVVAESLCGPKGHSAAAIAIESFTGTWIKVIIRSELSAIVIFDAEAQTVVSHSVNVVGPSEQAVKVASCLVRNFADFLYISTELRKLSHPANAEIEKVGLFHETFRVKDTDLDMLTDESLLRIHLQTGAYVAWKRRTAEAVAPRVRVITKTRAQATMACKHIQARCFVCIAFPAKAGYYSHNIATTIVCAGSAGGKACSKAAALSSRTQKQSWGGSAAGRSSSNTAR
jgi:hypothetical protein